MNEIIRILLDCVILFVWIQMLIHAWEEPKPIEWGEWRAYKR